MTSGPKRHHQVPKFYLERFASDGKVLVRRRDGKTFEADPVNVAVESGYYDIPDGIGGVSKEVEEGLGPGRRGRGATTSADRTGVIRSRFGVSDPHGTPNRITRPFPRPYQIKPTLYAAEPSLPRRVLTE